MSGSFAYDHFQFYHINAGFLPAFGTEQRELNQYGICIYLCPGLMPQIGQGTHSELDLFSSIGILFDIIQIVKRTTCLQNTRADFANKTVQN